VERGACGDGKWGLLAVLRPVEGLYRLDPSMILARGLKYIFQDSHGGVADARIPLAERLGFEWTEWNGAVGVIDIGRGSGEWSSEPESTRRPQQASG